MNELGRGSAIIYDGNEVAGIFTERDFVTKILDDQRQSADTLITDVMTPAAKLICSPSTISLGECQRLMVNNNIRHMPLLEGGRIIGVLSSSDITRSLQANDLMMQSARLFGNTLAQVESQQKELANIEALDVNVTKQDILRTAFVVTAATAGVALYQADWIHSNDALAMIITFVIGYVGIVFEGYFEFNKAAVALIMAVALWVIHAGASSSAISVTGASLSQLSEKISEISEVVYFLLGAMTIVEIMDAHQGFQVVTNQIRSKNKRGLFWVISGITFFMSAILDNLTTTIVMVSLTKKILVDPEDRKLFGAMIVVAANAGGAWTPIGDVTTTMLWINGQITALPTVTGLFFPSLVSVLLSVFALQRYIKVDDPVPARDVSVAPLAPRGKLVFAVGVLGLLSVPLFKAVTGLPPYLGTPHLPTPPIPVVLTSPDTITISLSFSISSLAGDAILI